MKKIIRKEAKNHFQGIKQSVEFWSCGLADAFKRCSIFKLLNEHDGTNTRTTIGLP